MSDHGGVLDAGFGRFIDNATIEYERFFPHPAERVWRAITEPAEIGEWLFPLSLDLKLGGAWRAAGEGAWSGVITVLDPPRRLRFGHGAGMIGGEAGYFEYELTPALGGVRLKFTQHYPGVAGGLAREKDGVAGGWHEIFDRLAEWVDGAPIGSGLPRTDLGDLVETWAERQAKDGAFDAATARRYALDLRRDEVSGQLNRRYRQRQAAGRVGHGDSGLARFIDHWTIEFVRTYPHPIERVWHAIADAHEIGVWFIQPTVWEPVTGGRYRFHNDDFAGRVEAAEPPRLIRFRGHDGAPAAAWPGAEAWFQFELAPVAGGTRLTYTQHAAPGVADPDEPDPDFVSPGRPGALAGWHTAFEELGYRLDGVRLRDRRMPRTRTSEIARDWAQMGMSDAFTPEQKQLIIIGLRARERHLDYVDLYREHVRATRPAKTNGG